MKFIYKSHFKFRAKQRGISLKLAKEVYKIASGKYFDELRNHHIAVGEMEFEGQVRKVMVAYDKIGETIEFVTTHKIRDLEVKNKVKSGRWKHEQN